MKKIPIRIISTQASDSLQVRFMPTDICNFKCSYCFPGSGNVNKFRYPSNTDLVIKNFRKLFDLYKTQGKNKFHLMLTGGGEPSLWPEVDKFCREIKQSHEVFISMITNGSRTVRWWKENRQFLDDVVLSCHNEFTDIEHYMEVGDLLFEAGVKVTGLVIMDATNWDKCVELIERMKTSKQPWFIEAKPAVLFDGGDVNSYTDEQMAYFDNNMKRVPDGEWILKRLPNIRIHESIVLFDDESTMAARPHEILTNKWNYFKGWQCNIGLEGILISADGEVTASCGLDVFGGKKLNVFAESFDPDIVPQKIICSHEGCFCQPDTHVSKIKVS